VLLATDRGLALGCDAGPAAALIAVGAPAELLASGLIAHWLVVIIVRCLDRAAQWSQEQNREQKFPLHAPSLLFYLGP
jgi:hypothetical protein